MPTSSRSVSSVKEKKSSSPAMQAGERRATKLPSSLERAILAAQLADDNKGRDVLILDMTGLVTWCDYMVLATASSRRQVAAIGDDIDKHFEALGDKKVSGAGYTQGSWLVVDYGDVCVHVFSDESREYYQLEHLWGDAPRVDWQRGAAGA